MKGYKFMIDKLEERKRGKKTKIPDIPLSQLQIKWDLPRNQRFAYILSNAATVKHSLQLHFRSCDLRNKRVRQLHKKHVTKISQFHPFNDDPLKDIPFSKFKKKEEFTELTHTVIPKMDEEYFLPYHLRFPHEKG